MPRNTFLVVSLLAIFAALVIGVNMGKRLGNPAPTPLPSPTIGLSPSPTPAQSMMYRSVACSISFDYPVSLIKQETPASTSAIFTDPQNTSSTSGMIVFTCQKDIPKPPLPTDKIEAMKIGSVSGTLYHDTTAHDGKPIDKLIFHHPKTGLDIFLAGLGPTFQHAIDSLKILPQ